MSVKLSSLSPRFDELSRRETLPKLVASLGALVGDPAARDDDDFTIFVDAEEQNRLELTLAVVEATVREHAPKSIGVVVQAYGRRAMPTLEYLRELATTYPGTKFKVGCHTGPHTTALAL
jgi:RHH-type proline utilization regulon transcriptional repressor/proline dehydrogenase/delta 1-pyrroline-5-carboxylate dehydrogenase